MQVRNKVLVTGGSGFVGLCLARKLLTAGYNVRCTYYSGQPPLAEPPVEWFNVGAIGSRTDWEGALDGVCMVVHAAGLAHAGQRDYGEIREINTHGTVRLAEAAVQKGVKRFIFISTAHVHGTQTHGNPFTEGSKIQAVDPYARSKYEAEVGLRKVSDGTRLGVTIVRPTLIYGATAKGNFPRLVKLVRTGVPLPLAAIENKRSLLCIDNLVDVLERCLRTDDAIGEAFLVADSEPVSTPRLLTLIAKGLDVRLRLWRLPHSVLRIGGRLSCQLTAIEKLCESLEVSNRKVRAVLQWSPQVSIEDGIIEAARAMRPSDTDRSSVPRSR